MARVFCVRAGPSVAPVTHFSVQQLEDALQQLEDAHHPPEEGGALVGECGRVCGATGTELARVCVRARLAPSAPAATGILALLPAGILELRVLVPVCDSPELLLWFDQAALCALDMPVLVLRHIHAHHYRCDACPCTYPDPNPLKVHLLLRCAPAQPRAFWREVAARLRAPASPAQAPALPPAQLEALAAEWGRGARGHACLYCGKLYSRRYGLKIHLRTHTGYRPLACRYCGRAFGDPSNLNKHVRLHRAAQIKRAPLV